MGENSPTAKLVTPIFGAAILVLITVNVISYINYKKAQVEIQRVKEENETLRHAISKPAVEQKPKIEIRTETKVINLSEEQKKQLEEKYGAEISKLLTQLATLQSTITTWSYDGGHVSVPVIPKPPEPITPLTQITKMHIFSLGILYLHPLDIGVIGVWEPPLKYPFAFSLQYTLSGKFGIGVLYSFKL